MTSELVATVPPLVDVALGAAGSFATQYLATRETKQQASRAALTAVTTERKEAVLAFLEASQRVEHRTFEGCVVEVCGESGVGADGALQLRAAHGEAVPAVQRPAGARAFPGIQCFPACHRDGGRDTALPVEDKRAVIFQVKWASHPSKDPVIWLTETIK
ncbi:hypothetical protein [Kitasatospora sp. NPDC088783]|uniref:hypothetical protein n=1 Tax=Kitasatospora sp. NPDC088783 TaxID=3364077 RepID=UPI003810CBEE